MALRFVLFLLCFVAIAIIRTVANGDAGLAKRIDTVIDGPDYKHAHWGILIVNTETGEPVYARNADKLFAPASVTKLFSCAAALVALGADHRFETTVRQRGDLKDGLLTGDLILVAGGDLTFGARTGPDGKTLFKEKDHTYANSSLVESELTDTDPLAAIKDLAKQVKAAGIKEIQGEVGVDDRLFAKSRGSGSGPDLITPIIVNDNVVDLIFTPAAKSGEPATVHVRPESQFFDVDAVIATAGEEEKPEIHLIPLGPNRFAIRGKVPAGAKPLVRIYPINDPSNFARTLFIEAMKAEGITVQSAVVMSESPEPPSRTEVEKLPVVATYRSAPFKDVIAVTLKVSHNLYASTLPALVAAKAGKDSVEAGLHEQGKILKELGVDVETISFGGSAGGARPDFVSPRATVQVLQGMAKRPEWDAYSSALPILGEDGTLEDAVSASSPARGKVQAKNGTLVWTDSMNDRYLLTSKALAGVMTTKAGTKLAFAIFVNNNPLPPGVSATRESKTLGKLAEIVWEFGP